MHIGLLEDDRELGALFGIWLEALGHRCTHCVSGRDFLARSRQEPFDMMILDWRVEDLSGEEVLRHIRDSGDWRTPILFVTGRDAEEDVVKILLAGADDYMAKPVNRREMQARVVALARRVGDPAVREAAEIRCGEYTLDTRTHTVRRHGEPIELTTKEFELAAMLFRNMGRLIPRDYILKTVWGYSGDVQTRTIDTHISRLRGKLGLKPESGWRLTGVYHFGYRLERLDERASTSAAAAQH